MDTKVELILFGQTGGRKDEGCMVTPISAVNSQDMGLQFVAA